MALFTDLIKRGLGIPYIQKGIEQFGQKAPERITTPILRAENVMRNPPMLQIPRYEAPRFLPSTVKFLANTAINLPSMVAEQTVNTPALLLKGVTNTARNLSDQYNFNERVPLTKYATDIAPFAEGMLNVATGSFGGSLFKNATKSIVQPALKKSVANILKGFAKDTAKMSLEGATIGGLYGGIEGVKNSENLSTEELLNNAIKGTSQGIVGGAVMGPVIGHGVKAIGKTYGATKDILSKKTPLERQSGFVDLKAPVGKQFKEPYVRGDIRKIEDQLDTILNTKSNMNGKWNSKLPSRETAFKELEYYAGQGEQGAIDALAQARALEADLIKAQTAKATPVIKTSTGKTMKQMLAKKKPVSDFEAEMDALIKEHKPQAQFKPKTPPIRIMGEEVKQQADIAQINAEGNTPSFDKIMAEWVGKKKSAETKGTLVGSKIKNVPADPIEVIKAIENPNIKNTPEVEKYMTEYRKLDNEVFNQAKQAGIDIKYLKNHIAHLWNQPEEVVQKQYQAFKQKYGLANTRLIPTYEEGIKMGLTPKYTSPAQILAESVKKLEETKAGIEAFRKLKDQGFIVPATVGIKQKDFMPITAPGFTRNVSRVNEELGMIGNWYAPREIATQINTLFSPKEYGPVGSVLKTTRKVSGIVQDVGLSGGAPGTPANAFGVAQMLKETTAGRPIQAVKSFIRSFSDKASKDYFEKQSGQLVKMQERNVSISPNFNINNLVGGVKKDVVGAVRNAIKGQFKDAGGDLANIWHRMVNDPTFQRFMPQLQVSYFNDIEKAALKKGFGPKEAADIAAKAVKNFYGLTGTDITARGKGIQDPMIQDILGTFTFAPKFRESMINFWANNVKTLKNPLALENRANTTFIAGAIATYLGMDYLNYKLNGKHIYENPKGTEDKLLIPTDTGEVIGIPFLSSIGTVPRALFREGKMLLSGDIKGTVKDIGQTYTSMLFKPFMDLANNADYFGKEIAPSEGTSQEKVTAQAKYLYNQFVMAHPYLKEVFDSRNQSDPAYQRISRAMELPLRFYTQASIGSKYYYGAVDKILNTLSDVERNIFNSIPKADSNDPNTRILKYQTFLTYPSIFEAKQKIELETSAKTGRPPDPLYLVDYDLAKKYMRYESLPEGSTDRKSMTQSYPELITMFQIRNKYFQENPLPAAKTQTTTRPIASPEVQAAMDRKDWNYPGVKDYLNANTEFNNSQREKLGLPGTTSGGSGSSYTSKKVSNFLKYDKYKWSNLKAKSKASIKKAIKGTGKKISVKSVKSILKGIKAPKKRKSLALKLPKKPILKINAYKPPKNKA
jgi:hypothetical protein